MKETIFSRPTYIDKVDLNGNAELESRILNPFGTYIKWIDVLVVGLLSISLCQSRCF